MRARIARLLLALLLVPCGASALEQSVNGKELQDRILEKAAELLATKRVQPASSAEAANDAINDGFPRVLPSATQVTAPSSAGTGTTLVDLAAFPTILGAAFDHDLLNFQGSAFTVDLNAFAFASLADPGILDAQSRYAARKYRIMRRFAGSLTIGGKGDSARSAERLGDIVTWELKARVFGSRDRRDTENLARYISAWADRRKSAGGPLADLADTLNRMLTDFIVANRAALKINDQGFTNASHVEALLDDPGSAAALLGMGELLDVLNRAAARALREIDGRPIWTLVGGGTEQRSQFGPRKWHLGLRVAFATGLVDHAINVDRLNAEGLHDAPDARTWKAGYAASRKLLQNTRLSEDGVTLSWAVSAEHSRDVPGSKHASILRSNVRLEFPLTKTLVVPVAISYANHQDLLTDQSQVIGHIGLAFDLSALKKKKGG